MLVAVLIACLATAEAAPIRVGNHWSGGFEGFFTVHADHAVTGWKAHLRFDSPVDSIEIWHAKVISKSGDGREYVVENVGWDGTLSAGQDLDVNFLGHYSGSNPPSGTITVEGMDNQPVQTQPPAQSHTNPPGNPATSKPSGGQSSGGGGGGSPMKYNYGDALGLSILFYDAQRSGRLWGNNSIPWRGDSAVNDNDGGHDLSGGWYDAGDHVKFNLPMAYSTWVLEWGFLRFQDAYKATGNLDKMCGMIKWPLDYFLKCWIPDQNVLYVQVGDGGADHGYWGRPENMNMGRPAFKVTAGRPGSDVAGDTAAALAAGSLVFKNICGMSGYANTLLTAAKSLYAFAKNHKGIYSQSVSQASNFYGSTGYNDELAVAAAWLHKATQESQYLQDAKGFSSGSVPWALSWDDTNVAADLLLYEITKEDKYKTPVEGFVKAYMPGGGVAQTPCGLAYRDQWGANRYAANAAFVAVMAAEDGINADQFKTWAMSQINYLLGDNKQHMSFEIGFGSRYPTHPHHRGSSCPTTTTQCNIGNGGPNPNLLKGALVGGPDGNDNYQDRRDDYVKNEVACDYNAGFQSALAGLKHFSLTNSLPAAPAAKC